MTPLRIAVIRLGAMGDVIHALPAVASLKHSLPQSRLTWIIDGKWASLLEGNPFVDQVISVETSTAGGLMAARRVVGRERFDLAVDLQGLFKSALLASAARSERVYGFHHSALRERLAAFFYSHTVRPKERHVVDQNLELVAAAGAVSVVRTFSLPQGEVEGTVPAEPFVLASPLAGWPGKQWPADYWARLASLVGDELNMPLVVNGPPGAAEYLERIEGARPHFSGIAGLIDVTRRAVAVAGVDSGPLQLAAALGKLGVAIFGPTDPERNGPYGGSIEVLRSPRAVTSYKRRRETDASMLDIEPSLVLERLASRLSSRANCAD